MACRKTNLGSLVDGYRGLRFLQLRIGALLQLESGHFCLIEMYCELGCQILLFWESDLCLVKQTELRLNLSVFKLGEASRFARCCSRRLTRVIPSLVTQTSRTIVTKPWNFKVDRSVPLILPALSY